MARLSFHSIFVSAAPHDGKGFGHKIYDSVWAAAQVLDLAVGLHLAVSSNYTGSQYYRDEDPGFMWVTINVIQDPRNAPATMVYDGVFEPKVSLTLSAKRGKVCRRCRRSRSRRF